MQDLYNRQRNIVFPDTAANEARFWRNVLVGRQRLTAPQVVGLALVAFAVIWAILLRPLLDWVIGFTILAGLLGLFSLMSGRQKGPRSRR
jgi:hypothetical protein